MDKNTLLLITELDREIATSADPDERLLLTECIDELYHLDSLCEYFIRAYNRVEGKIKGAKKTK